jgi:hypothetical protein
MQKTISLACLIVIFQTVAGQTEAPSKGQYGNMIYTIPNGWKVQKFDDGDILTAVGLPKGEFMEIWVEPSMNFSGSMEEALQKCYEETTTKLQATRMREVNGGNYSAQAAKTSFRGWDYIRCSAGIKLGGGDYPPEFGLDLFVIKLNGRFEQVSVIKSRNNCGMATYYPSSRQNYYNMIENFLFSLQFPDWREPGTEAGKERVEGMGDGPAAREGIVGAWQGISMTVGMTTAGAGLGAELKTRQLIFFSNGQAYFGNDFPAEGLDRLNTRIRAENNRRDWGTYSFSNGNGLLRLPYADIPLRMTNGRLVVNTNKTDHEFVRIRPVDGARFEGTYGLGGRNGSGQAAGKTPVIRFTADGQFADDGAMKVLYHEYTDCLNLAKDPGSGTYEVKNFSIVFNYSDGRVIRIAFLGADYDKGNPSPGTLSLSFYGNVLTRL